MRTSRARSCREFGGACRNSICLPSKSKECAAATEGRILITHDRNTMTKYARTSAGRSADAGRVHPAGRSADLPIGRAIEEIVIVGDCSTFEEWTNRIEFLPL
jgi:hypothetical protein